LIARGATFENIRPARFPERVFSVKFLVQFKTSDFPRKAVGIGSARVSVAASAAKSKAMDHGRIVGLP
jgi:hypothetical protein